MKFTGCQYFLDMPLRIHYDVLFIKDVQNLCLLIQNPSMNQNTECQIFWDPLSHFRTRYNTTAALFNKKTSPWYHPVPNSETRLITYKLEYIFIKIFSRVEASKTLSVTQNLVQ